MLFDRETRRRLSDLGRGKVPADSESVAETQPPASSPPPPVRCVGRPERLSGPLEELLTGVAREVPEGEYYELLQPAQELEDWEREAIETFVQAAAGPALPGLLGKPLESPQGLLCFDIETTGLNNEPLFLVGILVSGAEGVHVRQLLARHYAEEAAVLAEASRLLAAAPAIISYNGKGFDVPYIRNRLRYHKLPGLRVPHHLDLLLTARQRLGRSLGDCRLQTLERHLCGRERCHDISGADIPQAYHDFVALGDAGDLQRIIEHNRFDLITLAELLARLGD
jgi:uncharacterized protein YprB with RNaseH-like and TPR domain